MFSPNDDEYSPFRFKVMMKTVQQKTTLMNRKLEVANADDKRRFKAITSSLTTAISPEEEDRSHRRQPADEYLLSDAVYKNARYRMSTTHSLTL